MELIVLAAIGLAVSAYCNMDWAARYEMRRWFWLMMVVGATAGIGYKVARDALLYSPGGYTRSAFGQ